MKSAIKLVNHRPYGVQDQWDQHWKRMRKRRLVLRLVKFTVVPVVVLGFLVLGASTLSFG